MGRKYWSSSISPAVATAASRLTPSCYSQIPAGGKQACVYRGDQGSRRGRYWSVSRRICHRARCDGHLHGSGSPQPAAYVRPGVGCRLGLGRGSSLRRDQHLAGLSGLAVGALAGHALTGQREGAMKRDTYKFLAGFAAALALHPRRLRRRRIEGDQSTNRYSWAANGVSDSCGPRS